MRKAFKLAGRLCSPSKLSVSDAEEPSPIDKDELMGAYELDETLGLVAVDSHGLSNGVIDSGVTINQAGKVGKAFLFNGTASGKVDFDAPYYQANIGNNATICGWVKYPSPPSASELIIDFYSGRTGTTVNGFYLLSDASGFIEFYGKFGNNTADRTGYTTNSISDGAWHFFAITKNGTSMELWIDGTKELSVAATYTGAMFVGDSCGLSKTDDGFSPSNLVFSGLMDQVFIFNTPQSDTNMEWLYNSGSGRAYSEL